MKQALTLVFAAFLPLAAFADTPLASAATGPEAVVNGATVTDDAALAETATDPDAPEPWAVLDAADADLEALRWVKRPIMVFANTPQDPQFLQQMRNLDADIAALVERDVVVIVDTDPAARTEVRTRLRPRGFSMVLLDKDGMVMLRKPSPWSLREIVHAIDKFPLRRQEMLEQRPAGR